MRWSTLGHGVLTGEIRSTADISDDDWRKTNPRFVGQNFQRNLRIVDEVKAVAAEVVVASAFGAAWLVVAGGVKYEFAGSKCREIRPRSGIWE